MKIIYISNSRLPTEMAYGIQIMQMCRAFSDFGVEVKLILPTRKNPHFKNVNPFEYYNVKKDFKIKRIFTYDPNWLMKLPTGIYIKFQALLFNLSLFFYLLFKKDKNDNIFYTRDEYLLPLLQKFSGRVVWEAHTLPTNKKKYLKHWQKCQKIISISQGLKDELVKMGLSEDKILVAHDGVDLKNYELRITNYELRKTLNLPENKKVIMYAGHLYQWKGVEILAEASKFLAPDNVIVFVGGNELEVAAFKKRIKPYLDNNKILILGHQPPNKIPLYLHAADVLIIPNTANDIKSETWTSPLKMFEYMASGKPIVASNLPSIREILNENNAVLVKPDNAESLTKGIEKVLTDRELADKIKTQALKDVQNYTWQKRAEKIIKFIK